MRDVTPYRLLPAPFLALCLAVALCCPGMAGRGAAQPSSPAPTPFSPGESRHGFSQRETMPPVPEETTPEPLEYYRHDPPGSGRARQDQEDGPPGGLFRRITLAHDVEETLDVRRGHVYHPVRPAETFAPDTTAVYMVFRVFKHYAPYYVIGRLIPPPLSHEADAARERADHAPGRSGDAAADEDTASLALEDESGYLKFFAPPSHNGSAGWRPGRYRIEIFVGFEASDLTRMGAVRFTIAPRA